MIWRRLAAVLAALAVALAVASPAEATLRWRPCEENARCARLTVPLDRNGSVAGSISLRVLRALTFGRRTSGVTLVLAGEPGESAIQLLAGEYSPVAVVETLKEAIPRNRVVVLDQRGTGGSGPLRCRDLEAATPTDAGREAEACATLLGPRRGFYRTSDTVEDIEALRGALGVERLTVVGIGYGGYVAQRYASAHPQQVERLILDSPVDAAGLDPLRLDSLAAARRVLSLICQRGCAGFTRDALADTARLSEQLAREPLRGQIVGLDGRPRPATITPEELLFTIAGTRTDLLSQVDFPAAVAAALEGDAAPLFRLKRRAVLASKVRHRGGSSAATRAAVLCEETRFPWRADATTLERDAAAAAAGALLNPGLAAPFGARAAIRSDLIRLCRRWPLASLGPPAAPVPMPDIPVLVLASETNVGAPLETARRSASRFPGGALVVAPTFSAHPLFDDSFECVSRAVEQFAAGRTVTARCPRGRPLVAPGRPPPTSLVELRPVAGVRGKRGRVLRAVELTLLDAIDEYFVSILRASGAPPRIRGTGLRGGRWIIAGDASRIHRYEFVPGVRMSVRGRADEEHPILDVEAPDGLGGRLRVGEVEDDALAYRVRGRLGGRRVRAKLSLRTRVTETLVPIDESRAGSATLDR